AINPATAFALHPLEPVRPAVRTRMARHEVLLAAGRAPTDQQTPLSGAVPVSERVGVGLGLGQRDVHGSLLYAIHRLPNTGSLYGVGGSCQVPVDGGRTSASTCTSMTQGRRLRTACVTASCSAALRVTVTPSAPAAR